MPDKELEQKIEFHAQAREELAESANWYEERKSELGEEFLDEVESKLRKIANKPNSYPVVYQDVRQASLSRFPYLIFYIIKSPFIFVFVR
jgi:hypothetical protein